MEAWSTTLLSITNLRLLSDQIRAIAETPTFSRRLGVYIAQLQQAIDSLIDRHESVPPQVTRSLSFTFSSLVKFLTGSASKRIPYEIAYALELALKDWMKRPAIVTTAISPELLSGYYFQGVPESFYDQLAIFLDIVIDERLVQISLPEIYRHRPLYCTPLYHELGHFVDVQFGVTSQWLLSVPPPELPLPKVPIEKSAELHEVHKMHRMEYFADIFAAAYTGDCVSEFLAELIGAEQGASPTHPATADRIALVNDFLCQRKNPILESLAPILGRLGLSSMTCRFASISVASAFDNMHPANIKGAAEIHGIFPATWHYLKNMERSAMGNWQNMPPSAVEQVVNNLVEKSIRNSMIMEKWSNGAA